MRQARGSILRLHTARDAEFLLCGLDGIIAAGAPVVQDPESVASNLQRPTTHGVSADGGRSLKAPHPAFTHSTD